MAQTATATASTMLGPLKQVNAGLLNVGYVDAGPGDGKPVILLHSWPYGIHSFAEVAPVLASAGYRLIVPYLRGYGTTTFLSSETFRNGQPSALALVSVSGYLIGSQVANKKPLPPAAELQ